MPTALRSLLLRSIRAIASIGIIAAIAAATAPWFFSPPLATDQNRVAVTIELMATKPNGKPWDTDTLGRVSAPRFRPDIRVAIGDHIETCHNNVHICTFIVTPPSHEFDIRVWDDDAGFNDAVGETTCRVGSACDLYLHDTVSGTAYVDLVTPCVSGTEDLHILAAKIIQTALDTGRIWGPQIPPRYMNPEVLDFAWELISSEAVFNDVELLENPLNLVGDFLLDASGRSGRWFIDKQLQIIRDALIEKQGLPLKVGTVFKDAFKANVLSAQSLKLTWLFVKYQQRCG